MHTKKFLNSISIVLITLAILSLAATTPSAQAGAAADMINIQRASRSGLAGVGISIENVLNQTDIQPPISPIATTTPNEDGSIAHVVKYGETLIMIADAYSITLSDLISMNKLDPNNPVIFEGQPLLIRVAFTATPFITTTFTPRPPTRTPLPTRTPRPTRTETPFLSPTPTRTATNEPLIRIPTLEEIGPSRPVLAYAAFGISLIALVALIASAFWPGKRR